MKLILIAQRLWRQLPPFWQSQIRHVLVTAGATFAATASVMLPAVLSSPDLRTATAALVALVAAAAAAALRAALTAARIAIQRALARPRPRSS